MANKALRVLAVAYLDAESLPREINTENVEKELIFVRNNWNDGPTKRRRKASYKNL